MSTSHVSRRSAGRQRLSPPKLIELAGRADRPSVDPLEARQLLFSITITPDLVDPATGIGVAPTAIFGYTIPYLAPPDDIEIQDPELVVEDFDDELGMMQTVQNIFNGQIFGDSNLRVFHNIGNVGSGPRFAVRADMPGDNAFIEVRDMEEGEFFTFHVTGGAGFDDTFVGIREMTMVFPDAPSGVGLPIFDANGDPNMVVTLLFRGEVIASFSGDALADLKVTVGGNPGVGTFRFAAADPTVQTPPLFDEIRFEATSGVAEDFRIDDIQIMLPAGNFVDLMQTRIFGVELTFAGPEGATLTVLDLYGRDMELTLALGQAAPLNYALVDLDDNGIPEFNDGIGRIVVTGVNELSSITMWGGTIVPVTGDSIPDDAVAFEPVNPFNPLGPGFAYLRAPMILGQFDAFESSGFGYTLDDEGMAVGLPPGPGVVIIGAPDVLVRDNTSPATYNPAGTAPGFVGAITSGFNRVDQGFFVDGKVNLGRLMAPAVVHGSSVFSGSVGELSIGYLVGSVTVQGDAGLVLVGTDAGQWVVDPDTQLPGGVIVEEVNTTDAQLVIGRTVGEIAIAGRSVIDVTVLGDVDDTANRPPRDVFRYFEREFTFGIDENADVQEIDLITLAINVVFDPLFDVSAKVLLSDAPFFSTDQPFIFGNTFFRNDSILSAEFVGSIASAVEIHGELGFGDPLINTDEDPADVFAFVVDGTQPIVIEAQSGLFQLGERLLPPYVRVVDQDGRTLASLEATNEDVVDFVRLTFQPEAPGVYYLVVSEQLDGEFEIGVPYLVTISGMAPTALGSYRTGASSGDNDFFDDDPLGNAVTVLAGSVGSLRIGTGWINGSGTEIDPSVIFNTSEDDTDLIMNFRGGVFSIPGNLYNITTGSDIEGDFGTPVTIIVEGDFGTLVTGLSPLVGQSPEEGDVGPFNLQVGGSIAVLDIRGGLGINQDTDDADDVPPLFDPDSINIVTGTGGVRGDIGMIRVGSHVGAGVVNIETLPGATIGALLISQDIDFDPTADDQIGIYGAALANPIDLTLGAGSDVRFVDVPQLDILNNPDQFIPLIGSTVVELVDDGGGLVEVNVTGAPAGVTVGLLRLLPVNSSEGVAIARIENVDLSGGRTLRIRSLGPVGSTDVISIGSVLISNADANSRVVIEGNSQVDVWRILQTGGAAFNEITNTTPMGDIVAIDVVGLTSLRITTGDLGRTQVPAWGPKLIGPFYGLTGGAAGGSGLGAPLATLVVPAAGSFLADPFWNGMVYRPIRDVGVAQSYLDDLGSPIDPFLNGMVVRGGNVSTVRVGGAVGDVIVQAGNIAEVSANFDGITPAGRFDGIVGTIYANVITLVEIGDGLMQRNPVALSSTGIFANDDIVTIQAERSDGAFISSTIMAGNNVAATGSPTEGIDRIELDSGGSFIDAYIGSQDLDDFFGSYFGPEVDSFNGDLDELRGTGADFFRSQLVVASLNRFELVDGVFDASTISVSDDATSIKAAAFRNTTLTGGDLEFRFNQILIAEDLETLETLSLAGDMEDLLVEVLGSVTGHIGARNMTRVQFEVDNRIEELTATNIRASSVTAGQLVTATVTEAIRTSTFAISGPLESLIADEITNSELSVTGPDGEIVAVTARVILSGSIASSGPIGTISVTEGDMIASITTTGDNGNVTLLSAARDLDITTDISGTVTQLIAGRHIGNRDAPGVILVRGNVVTIDASSGQLYSDVRIGQSLTGSALFGPVTAKPGNNLVGNGSIIAFGRIELVEAVGDFGGSVISYSGGIGTVRVTDGSFLPGRLIAAFDGSVTLVEIVGGHLLGDIHADYDLMTVRVLADASGVFGDVGINPALTSGQFFDDRRNALPPGVAPTSGIDGPSITAGRTIQSIVVQNGSVFEATIFAGYALTLVDINGDVANDSGTTGIGTVFAAGDLLDRIDISGSASDAMFIAGLLTLGDDGRPGGTGANADVHKVGGIDEVLIGGDSSRNIFTAGMTEGEDGLYNTADDRVVPGVSFINTITVGGTVSDSSAFTDAHLLNIAPGITTGGLRFALVDTQIDPVEIILEDGTVISTVDGLLPIGAGAGPVGFVWKGVSGTLTFTGPGSAFWDAATGRVVLVNTSLASQLVVNASGTLTDFDIVTNDDGSMGLIDVNVALAGQSDIVVDAFVGTIDVQAFSGTGSIRVGGDAATVRTGAFTGGRIEANHIVNLTINGTFGDRSVFGEATITLLSAENITIHGALSGAINVRRNVGVFQAGTITIDQAMDRGAIRSGGSVGTFTAGSMSESRLSVRDTLGSVTVQGTMFDSAIIAGGDLGDDVQFGGTGLAADHVTSGFIGPVTISGDFTASDIVAGLLRGPDGFFGTIDDSIAEGRSTIGPVTISGTVFGSNLNSESYLIGATGSIASVTSGGQTVPDEIGNFTRELADTDPEVIQVLDLRVTQEALVHSATLFFNQPMDASTIGPALTVSEVRGGTDVTIKLVENVDYTVSYDPVTMSAAIVFARAVTDRDLPQVSSEPGPGVYRFQLDQDVLRAALVNARLDGDGNGFATAGDDYSQDDIVGDAGDKFFAETVDVFGPDGSIVNTIDFYPATNLDLVLDNNAQPDGLPDINVEFTLRATIGDHPDNETATFAFSGDIDLYSITLQAGQILRLGAASGSALFATRLLVDANLVVQTGVTDSSIFLPAERAADVDLTFSDSWLITKTGTYFILVGNGDISAAATPGAVNHLDPVPGGVGSYAFTIEVFDDGDTGFAATTDAGNGRRLVDAPEASLFAGPDKVFGTGDDVTTVTISGFTFQLDAGADGIMGTADDVVSGGDGQGATSTRTADGQVTTIVQSAIGPEGHAGVPGLVRPDVDVYHLSNKALLAPGTHLRITVRLSELGADLGSRTQTTLEDFTGAVQFALFDTTDAVDIGDALLVFSPTDFGPTATTPGVLADNGTTSYGYDEDGNFFVEFLTPGRLGAEGLESASYAVYLQGVFNTDYELEIVRLGTGTLPTLLPQNIFIETNGGSIDWLQAGGLTTTLSPFTTRGLGFTGTIGITPVDQFILNGLVDSLEDIFQAAGVDVRISTNPADFEFEDFSTVFLSNMNDPVNFFNDRLYGYSQHVDPLNADRSDEAVVFIPTLGALGYTPSEPDIELFTQSLTAAVARRIGELVGLRTTANIDPVGGVQDVMTAASVESVPGAGGVYRFSSLDRVLSNGFDTLNDTDFFLGQQNDISLLDRILAD